MHMNTVPIQKPKDDNRDGAETVTLFLLFLVLSPPTQLLSISAAVTFAYFVSSGRPISC